jgi:hypothetical protein
VAGTASAAWLNGHVQVEHEVRYVSSCPNHGSVGWLFGQDQLVRLRDAQSILLAVMQDDHFPPALEEHRALDAVDVRQPGGGLGRRRARSVALCAR